MIAAEEADVDMVKKCWLMKGERVAGGLLLPDKK